jgi:SSS family solute:Na+ symporter
LLKLLPVFIFIIPGMICFALAMTKGNGHRQVQVIQQELVGEDGEIIRDNAQAAFPLLVKPRFCRPASAGLSWRDCWPP